MDNQLYRLIPAVSKVLEEPVLVAIGDGHSPEAITAAVRAEIEIVRARLANGVTILPTTAEIAQSAAMRLNTLSLPKVRRVLNATGIVLHTNLGRSPMAAEAVEAAAQAAGGYLNLELDLKTGNRSSRTDLVREGIIRLTGAESGTVVNNCAAATVIVLRALAAGREVIISRGQLIEIGGSFRIPEIMTVSGAILREVGTTNITRISDYENAITPQTGLLMRVHTSNYRIRGFTESVGIDELVALGRRSGIPVVDDVGSGSVIDLTPFGLPGEPVVAAGIRAGADLVLFSGDKLLGGPQSGIIAGKKQWIDKIERDPLMRAFRTDKMTLAALETTLRLYENPERARQTIPTLRMLTQPLGELRSRTEEFARELAKNEKLSVRVFDDSSYAGGGSLPDVALPTIVIGLKAAGLSDAEFARRLRIGEPAVLTRIQNGEVLIDLRTIFQEHDGELFNAINFIQAQIEHIH